MPHIYRLSLGVVQGLRGLFARPHATFFKILAAKVLNANDTYIDLASISSLRIGHWRHRAFNVT
jgi:hypothetical protein